MKKYLVVVEDERGEVYDEWFITDPERLNLFVNDNAELLGVIPNGSWEE